MEKIVILKSKKKIYGAAVVSFLAVVVGIILFIVADNSKAPLLLQITGVATILFGLRSLYFLIKSIKESSVGLVVDETGINDTSTPTALGLIRWEEITRIEALDIEGTWFLLVQVINPEQYLERAKHMSRKPLKLGIKMYGTPVIISAHSLKCNFNELEDILQTSLSKYRQNW